MLRLIGTTLLSVILIGCVTHNPPPVEADYIFENVNIIPMDVEVVNPNQAVAVRNGQIVAIVDQAQSSHIRASIHVDGNGRYLMPGLADMHVHIRWDPAKMFKLYLANGVTTVFNMSLSDGSGQYDHVALREKVQNGDMLGPRYLISGPQLHKEEVPDLAAVTSILEQHEEHKYDLIKVHGDLSSEVFDALVSGARKRNLRIGGHSQHKRPINDSLQLDILEHVEELLYVAPDDTFVEANDLESFLKAYRANVEKLANSEYRTSIAKTFAESGTFIDPTLIVYATLPIWADDDQLHQLRFNEMMRFLPKDVKDYWLSEETNPYQEDGFPLTVQEIKHNFEIMLKLTKDLNDAGVSLLTGTDGFGTLVPGFSLQQEFDLMLDAGLSPYEVLRASTVNVAEYLGEQEISGIIRPEYRADFILLDENPLTNIKNISSVSGVYSSGTWLSRKDIENIFMETAHR
ncbi:amidohydrolase family protein [Hirschia maritima]|uniref:amidohydrolase family protein n=1 Tax=Hirschia maritima TaxID=1121961 RepID=UPI00037525D2|nr:amidohydrolase family protein [Hirschia maritima]